jgi:hypothetical protein
VDAISIHQYCMYLDSSKTVLRSFGTSKPLSADLVTKIAPSAKLHWNAAFPKNCAELPENRSTRLLFQKTAQRSQ